MPTYDYECPDCGHRFEKFHSISDPPVKTCPECKKRKVKRLIGSGAGLLFKGSGFYITDYRSDSYKKSEKAAQSESAPKSEKKASDSPKSSKSSDSGSKKSKSSKPES